MGKNQRNAVSFDIFPRCFTRVFPVTGTKAKTENKSRPILVLTMQIKIDMVLFETKM